MEALISLLKLELHVHPLDQRLVSVHLDRAVMDEDILAALGQLNKAVTLGVIEPLHLPCCHGLGPPAGVKT